MVHHPFSRSSSTRAKRLVRSDSLWNQRPDRHEVLAAINKKRTDVHVRRFVDSANQIVIFADSPNKIVSQHDTLSNSNYLVQNRLGRSDPGEQALTLLVRAQI